MGKYFFKCLITILVFLLIHAGVNSFAMDEGGCLTCHQYPGLVRLEKPKGVKAFHIDESEYLKSAHGEVDCRACHINVTKVPHAGETKVDCTSKCHLTKKDKQKLASYDQTTLHEKEKSYLIHLKDETSCRECHPLYPHSENNLVRSLLNMHTGFMFCEVCHIKRDKFTNISYEWADSENAQFVGKPFGTHFNPKTDRAEKPEDFISRIAVYFSNNGKKQSLMNTRDISKAKKYMLEEKNSGEGVDAKQLKYFHRDINKKEISVACNECHSSNSILDFKRLGFDEKKEKNLIYLNIKGLVTKYKTFYFPNLFGK